MLLSAADALM